uniref:V-type proton ATPase proteolipid subunit n=1 Tax=Neobodo designis TaxID=312471 RepID=A0A6U4RDC7_NEODS|mmetsp:Transcript_26137/g.80732  ORF Transcript_26137/g.80732 Transcript_26137/m.80732 type:complete len:199 (+) Transcript_26137:68-664(+)
MSLARTIVKAALFVACAALVAEGAKRYVSPEACKQRNYPASAGFFGGLGATVSLVFANLGSAYGTAKAGCGVAHLGMIAPDRIMRGIVPVVMAGILGIYGLIVAVIINNNIKTENNAYASFAGYMHFGAGLAAGLSSLAAGLAIGIVGDTSVRAYGKQEKIFVAMILMLIFAEALGLYGLIIALLMNNTANKVAAGCA